MQDTIVETDWYSEDAATFGDRLAAAREHAGLSQRDLAEQLGVKSSVILAWEEDRKEPRANRLSMLSGLLGISLTWLMTGGGDGPEAPADEAEMPPEVSEILTQIRATRAEITAASDRLARLEKQLRRALTQPGDV